MRNMIGKVAVASSILILIFTFIAVKGFSALPAAGSRSGSSSSSASSSLPAVGGQFRVEPHSKPVPTTTTFTPPKSDYDFDPPSAISTIANPPPPPPPLPQSLTAPTFSKGSANGSSLSSFSQLFTEEDEQERIRDRDSMLSLIDKIRKRKGNRANADEETEDGAGISNGSSAAVVTSHETAPLELQLLRLINRPVTVPRPGWFACPKFSLRIGKDADSKVSAKVVSKYSRYASEFCESTGFLQMHFGLATFLRVCDIIADIVSLRPGTRILDVGSGCGTMLNYYALSRGTAGLGIDLTGAAVDHSTMHARPQNTFCRLDATLLRLFPSNSFSSVVSWASLYHIRRSLLQCAVVNEICRLLKHNGRAWIGQLRTEKTQNYWRKGKCSLAATGCTWKRMSDANTFRIKSFKRNGFFSLLVVKTVDGVDSSANSTTNTRTTNNTQW